MIAHALFALIPLLSPSQEGRTDANQLVEEAWRFLPAYDGVHRDFLAPEVKRETTAASHLLEAALALKPDHVRALWSLGHAHILLGEDAKNRLHPARAREHYERAVESLTRAIDLQPEDPWALYARGTAHTNFGAHELALDDLTRSIEVADDLIERAAGDSSTSWLRFKAMEWRAETCMRAGDGERARTELRAFHAAFSNNSWPLHIALAECHQRERDFASARGAYEQILDEFPDDYQAYALLGYLEGLVGRREQACVRLLEALQRELEPGMYTRLWLWILATDEHRPAAEEELRELLAYPPSNLSAWDRRLGGFVLGEGTEEQFRAEVLAEVERRMAAGEPLDDLRCEAMYYLGLRLEREASRIEDGEARRARLDAARASYAEALSFAPIRWKWEWAYARVRFAALSPPDPIVEEDSLRAGARLTREGVSGVLERVVWHVPGTEAPTPEREGRPGVGDLMLGILATDGGRHLPVQVVVGLR